MDIREQISDKARQLSRRGVYVILGITAAGAMIAGLFASGNASVYDTTDGAQVHQGIVVGDCYHFNLGYDRNTGFFTDEC